MAWICCLLSFENAMVVPSDENADDGNYKDVRDGCEFMYNRRIKKRPSKHLHAKYTLRELLLEGTS